MENRYYTPEIEEFCVGFECEINPLVPFGKGGLTELSGKWEAFKCSNWNSRRWFNIEEKRVKLFDRADIESCGFKYSGLYDNDYPEFCKDIVRIRMWENNV